MATQDSKLNMLPSDMDPTDTIPPEPANTAGTLNGVLGESAGCREDVEPPRAFNSENARTVTVQPSPGSRLVTWTDSNSLGTEKFRALAIRLDAMRKQYKLTSLQVTSSVVNEGKSFVAANLAVTLSRYFGSKTLLIEGDLHRPMLGSMFGLKKLQGLNDWWSRRDLDIARFLFRFSGTQLWLLPAGTQYDQPSEILHSARFAEAFAQLTGPFDWVVVDSTPLLPVIDANLWSRLVDGTLLVVREGVTPLKTLKNGLQSLDHPNLIGVVVNEASEFNRTDYDGQYYGSRK